LLAEKGRIMGNPKRIDLPENGEVSASGITIEYIKSRDILHIWGWHGPYGIEGTNIPFPEFCRRLGINQLSLAEQRRIYRRKGK